MRSTVAWQETPPEKDGYRNVCYDLCFNPDGTELVAAVGNRVLVYQAQDGELLHNLKGHKDVVYCVAYSSNGTRFASGGADKTVIIWTSGAEGILKYTHNDSIQCLAYNPVTQQLASATATDFGLWSPEAKSVHKVKVSSKVTCMAWTDDGANLALGHYDGSVSIRDKAGGERLRLECGTSPVWSLTWSSQDEGSLAVGTLDGGLKLWQVEATQAKLANQRQLEYDPLSLSYFNNGECIVTGGSDKALQLYTKEGVFLAEVGKRSSWVWAARARPKASAIACGCEDGSITMFNVTVGTVHALHGDRYAYREHMTDVVVQHLITEQKVRIRCRDYVKKVALYQGKLAVQLPSRIVIYELADNDTQDTDAGGMQYRSATKIMEKFDCNLLVVTSRHVILCQERRLQLYNLLGTKEREWLMDSTIRYIKVVGGPEGREGLLVGLKGGTLLQVFIDNPFPVVLAQHTAPVRCLDLSPSRTRVAVVDDSAQLSLYDLATKSLLFTERGVNSVAFNSVCDDMVCYSGGGSLAIKTGDFPPHTQRMPGFVVGFQGSKVFCLHFYAMQTIDVPQSASMTRYLEQRDFTRAYQVACLGVPETDWRMLGMEALQALELEVARKALSRVKDVPLLQLIARVAAAHRQGTSEVLLRAEVLAHCGKFQDAAKAYTSAGALERVMEMFSDLRQFDQAKQWAEQYAAQRGDSATVVDLMSRQAEWSEQSSDYEVAAEMFVKARKYDRAAAIYSSRGWWDKLAVLVRQLDPSKPPEQRLLQLCAKQLQAAGQYQLAKEALMKLGDMAALMALYVQHSKWEDALLMVHAHPECREQVYLPYAKWLAASDRFEEAREAFRSGGRPDLATATLEQLTANAVAEHRYADASYCHYQLAMEALGEICSPPAAGMSEADQVALERFSAMYDRAEVYYAYDMIYRTITSPFRTLPATTTFNAAVFLVMRLVSREPPPGVSLSTVLYLLGKQCMHAGAHKLARFAYNKLQTMVLPPAWQQEVDLQSLLVRSHPFSDAEALLPTCYRCGSANALLNLQGDHCSTCGSASTRSFASFEPLPLVEFELEAGISDEEAQQLLGSALESSSRRNTSEQQQDTGGANVLRIDSADELNFGGEPGDPFAAQMVVPGQAIRLGRAGLAKLKPSEVVVRRWPNPHIPCQWFRVMDPDLPLEVGPCGHFFESDELEMAVLEQGQAPFSRAKYNAEGQLVDTAAATAAAASVK